MGSQGRHEEGMSGQRPDIGEPVTSLLNELLCIKAATGTGPGTWWVNESKKT